LSNALETGKKILHHEYQILSLGTLVIHLRLEVPTKMNMKITTFFDVVARSLVSMYICLRGTCCLHFRV